MPNALSSLACVVDRAPTVTSRSPSFPVASRAVACLLAVALAACGASTPPPSVPPPPPAATPPPVAAPESPPAPAAQASEEAHRLVVLAASCWFGGLWADALGEEDAMKAGAIENRCHDLERHVWGADDKTHYEQLRAFEQNAAADVVAKVDSTAKSDVVDGPRREALVKLATALAEALKETMMARRAADRVKRDLGDPEPAKLSTDEVDAVRPLRSHAKLEALLTLEAGDLSKEANALAILCALDRVEVARGLPRHLKLYAVGDSLHLLFGVAVPDVPEDGSKKLVPGTWLRFLVDTARAAGHPVPAKAQTPRERDALAWAGMLEGLHDKLKLDDDGVAATTDLNRVVATVLHRLEAEFHAQRAAEVTEGAKPLHRAPQPKKGP